MLSLGHDVRLALRRLQLAPGFTLFAVLSLAVGIGLTTLVYSAVRTVLWQPLGVPQPDRLLAIRHGTSARPLSWPDFLDFGRQQSSFLTVAASAPLLVAVGAGGGSQTVPGAAVSGDYFAVVGVTPKLGRLLGRSDEAGGRVAVVSESFWKTNLESDRRRVGGIIKLGGEPFELVGVVAGPFHGLATAFSESVWVPVGSIRPDDLGWHLAASGGQTSAPAFHAWARLAPTANLAQASAQVASFGDHRWSLDRNGAALPENRARDTLVFMVLTCIAAVLLIACTNLANLTLARETSRAQETAVRSALGATRWRLIREQLIESGFIVLAGGAAGLALAVAVVRREAVDVTLATGVAIHFPRLDPSLSIAALGGMALALAVFGLWPALQSSRADIRSRLGAGANVTMPKWRLHRTIIAWQVCGSVALLLVSLLAVRVVSRSAQSDLAHRGHDDLALAEVHFGLNGRNETQMRAQTAMILDRARVLAGTGDVAAVNGLPFGFLMFRGVERARVTTADFPQGSRRIASAPAVIAVTPSYFATTGTGLLRGTGFQDTRASGGAPVAVLNEAAARELFRSIDVVGRTIDLMPPSSATPAAPVATRILGVCANDQPWLTSGKVDAVVFVPFSQRYVRSAAISFLVHSSTPAAGAEALRSSVRDVDPDLAITITGVGNVLLDGPFFLMRVIVAMTTLLGVLALVLSMAGLFGVLSHLVSKRTREFGVRLALGAGRGDILWLVVRDGVRPVSKGLVLGLFIGAAARVAVKTFVSTDVSAFDLAPVVVLPIPFFLAAVAASYLPAARAARVDPNVALRDH